MKNENGVVPPRVPAVLFSVLLSDSTASLKNTCLSAYASNQFI